MRSGDLVAGAVECLRNTPGELGHDIVAESDLGGQALLAIAADATQRPAKHLSHGVDQDGIGIGWVERPSEKLMLPEPPPVPPPPNDGPEEMPPVD